MNVGHYAQTIHSGVDGSLAEDAEEFEKHLDTLISNRKLPLKMGLAAKERIKKDFNVDDVTATYVSCLRDAISRKAAVVMDAQLAGAA